MPVPRYGGSGAIKSLSLRRQAGSAPKPAKDLQTLKTEFDAAEKAYNDAYDGPQDAGWHQRVNTALATRNAAQDAYHKHPEYVPPPPPEGGSN